MPYIAPTVHPFTEMEIKPQIAGKDAFFTCRDIHKDDLPPG
jgi:hypothetical protein